MNVKEIKHRNAGMENFEEITGILPVLSTERAPVMLLGSDQPALRILYGKLRNFAKIVLAEDLPSAVEKLSRLEVRVIFCAACFHCGSWVEALETLGFLYPETPVVVVNEAAQNQNSAEHYAEIYAAGAFEVLKNPQDELGVLVVLAHALATSEARHWES